MKKWEKGIYCLETGEWFNSLKEKNSMEPVLTLLHDSPLSVPYIHRDIATEAELRYYLRKWTQSQHKGYPILYLAFHGDPGCIHLRKETGQPTTINTDDLFSLLKGKCHKRIIHFGACSVLDIHGHKVNRYLRESHAAAISGYAYEVDWVASSAFEMIYLAELQENQFTKPGMRAVRGRVRKTAPHLAKALGFRMRVGK